MKNIFLEEGLYLRYTHLRHYEDIEIMRLSKTPGKEIVFALCFLLGNPGRVLLTSNNNRLSAGIPEGSLSHTLELLFSREWLYTHLAGMEEKIGSIVDKLGAENTISVLTETTRAGDDHLLSEIAFELHKPSLCLLAVRSRALVLLADMISRIPGTPYPSAPEAPYVETIPLVEQQRMQSREDMLPSLKELAKEFALRIFPGLF